MCASRVGVTNNLAKHLINSLNQGFDRGNPLYHKLWTHLDNREKHGLRSTNYVVQLYVEDINCFKKENQIFCLKS